MIKTSRIEVAGKTIAKALGEELRRARETKGWSRAQFVARLPSGIGERTLLAYEHGLRQLTVIRLVELCEALGVTPPGTLTVALQKAGEYLHNLELQVDLRLLLADRGNKFRSIFPWARNRLTEEPEGIIELAPSAVRELAAFIGYPHDDLAGYLAKFTPEEQSGDPT
ncbi:helix-turn-helix transcriptional regulator [Actinophytocola sp.]|uniref:helix-turn-helix domain-containing protein n=1 Tax=Actinophytocola sp. TaxID=1872138 RepID=UPI002ED2901F